MGYLNEYNALVENMKKDINRQLFQGGFNEMPQYGLRYLPTTVATNPVAYRNLRRAIEGNKQHIAKLERRGKPSYRQRQKNGRAARHA